MKLHIHRIAAMVMLIAIILAAAGCQAGSDHKHHDSGQTASATAEHKPADGAERTGAGKDSHVSTETGKEAGTQTGNEAAKNVSAENSSATVTKTGSAGSSGKGNGSGTEQQGQTTQAAAGNSSASEPSGSTSSIPVRSTSDQTDADASSANHSVTFSIKGDKKHGTILPITSISIEKGETVLDLLKRVTRKNKIQMEFRGSGATAYVEGIDNLYEFDLGPESGWIYKVNGLLVDEGAGTFEIKKGDVIEWIYTIKRENDSEDKG